MKKKLNFWIGLMLGVVALLGVAQGLRNRFIDTFDTVADLVANGGKAFPVVHVLGYYSPGDGGGGTFLLTNAVSGTNFGSRIYSSRLGQSWERVIGDTFSVKFFGARGDGITDDTMAITNALATMGNGRTLYFPKGTYLSDSIDLRDYRNITLRGSEQSSEFQYVSATVLKCRTACQTFIKLADDDQEVSSNNGKGIVVRDLQIDANGLATTGINGCLANKLENMRVLGAVSDGIVFEGGTYPIHLEHVSSILNGRHGLNIKAPFTTVYTVSNSEFGFNGSHGINIEAGSTCLFENVLCQSNTGDGFHVNYQDPSGFGHALYFERLTFENCYSEANGGWGLYVTSFNTNPATFVGKITDLGFFNCSFNSGVSQQVYIRGTTTPTIIGSPFIGAALDPTYNTTGIQTYRTYGNQNTTGNTITTGKRAVGTTAVDASAMDRVVSDGMPTQYERSTLNTWQIRHPSFGGPAAVPGFGLYNSTSNRWGWFATQNGTFDAPDRSAIAKTSNYQITAADNGVRFSNQGASGAVTLTLPDAVSGMHFAFVAYENQSLTLAAKAGDSIRDGNVTGSVTLSTKGSILYLFCAKSGEWFVGHQNIPSDFTTLTDGATITLTGNGTKVFQNAKVTLGGNRALAFSGVTDGMRGTLVVIQDATGGRTLSLPAGSKVENGGGGAITLTATPNAVDQLDWVCVGSTYYWTARKNFN